MLTYMQRIEIAARFISENMTEPGLYNCNIEHEDSCHMMHHGGYHCNCVPDVSLICINKIYKILPDGQIVQEGTVQ